MSMFLFQVINLARAHPRLRTCCLRFAFLPRCAHGWDSGREHLCTPLAPARTGSVSIDNYGFISKRSIPSFRTEALPMPPCAGISAMPTLSS